MGGTFICIRKGTLGARTLSCKVCTILEESLFEIIFEYRCDRIPAPEGSYITTATVGYSLFIKHPSSTDCSTDAVSEYDDCWSDMVNRNIYKSLGCIFPWNLAVSRKVFLTKTSITRTAATTTTTTTTAAAATTTTTTTTTTTKTKTKTETEKTKQQQQHNNQQQQHQQLQLQENVSNNRSWW